MKILLFKNIRGLSKITPLILSAVLLCVFTNKSSASQFSYTFDCTVKFNDFASNTPPPSNEISDWEYNLPSVGQPFKIEINFDTDPRFITEPNFIPLVDPSTIPPNYGAIESVRYFDKFNLPNTLNSVGSDLFKNGNVLWGGTYAGGHTPAPVLGFKINTKTWTGTVSLAGEYYSSSNRRFITTLNPPSKIPTEANTASLLSLSVLILFLIKHRFRKTRQKDG